METCRFSVTVPKEIKDWLEKNKKDTGASYSYQIIKALERSKEEEEKKK